MIDESSQERESETEVEDAKRTENLNQQQVIPKPRDNHSNDVNSEDEANLTEEAKRFNEGLLGLLISKQEALYEDMIRELYEGAPKFVKHPVSFNKVLTRFVGDGFYSGTIRNVFLGKRSNRHRPGNVYIPAMEDLQGFETLVMEMIHCEDDGDAANYKNFLIGDNREEGFQLRCIADTLDKSELFNKIMMALLEKYPDDKRLFNKIHDYCRDHSKYQKRHEASYIPLLNKLYNLEHQ